MIKNVILQIDSIAYANGLALILLGINDNSLTGACLLDVSKCFYSINHEILLKS